MTVARILADKGHDVMTIGANSSLLEVAQVLSGRRIGAVVIVDERRSIVGIVSERDIVRVVANGPSALSDSAQNHMTSNVVTCTEATEIDQLMELMTEGKFRHVPVVDGSGRLTGIVSIGDVVKSRVAAIESEHQALREYIATA